MDLNGPRTTETGLNAPKNGPQDISENDQVGPRQSHGESGAKRATNGPKRATNGPKRAGNGPRAPVPPGHPRAPGDPPMGSLSQESKVRSIREKTRLSCANLADTCVSEQKPR